MEENIGSTDRIARVLLGTLLAVIGVAGAVDFVALGTGIGILLAVIGVVLLGTAAFRLCILYEILDIRTN